MVLLKNTLRKFLYKTAVQAAKNASPDKIEKVSQDKALEAFRNAYEHLPGYRKYATNAGLKNPQINDIQTFKNSVPVLDKHIIYHESSLLDQLDFEGIQSVLLSSGSTGSFSFGLSTQKETARNTQFLSILFDHYFNILNEPTLIINCLTQAVKLPSLDVVSVEIGPRADSLLYVLKNFSHKFGQTIIIGDNYFLKNSLEEGQKTGFNYSKLKLRLITGGVFLPENLRTHLANLTGIPLDNFDQGSIISSMGISEFGLNLFFETPETIRLRRQVSKDVTLKNKLLKAEYPAYLPMFFNYFPESFYLEERNQEIIISNLNVLSKLPLIRYNTHDKGRIIPYAELKEMLKDSPSSNLLPPFKSALVLMYSKDEYIQSGDAKVYPQQIQENLYSDSELASFTTGYFRLSQENENGKLEIQLKKGLTSSAELKTRFQKTALKDIPLDLSLHLYAYRDFPYGMELDYERKFKYVS